VKHFVQRGLVLLGASAISLGLASPALASGHEATPRRAVVQRQSADLSNETDQRAVAFAPAVQVAPAVNVGVLNSGGQSIRQANSNSSNAQAGNWNSTSQTVSQHQSAVPAHKHAKHHGKSGKHHGKSGKHDHKAKGKHHKKFGKHECRPAKHDGKRGHSRKSDGAVSQRQSAEVSNDTDQKAVAFAPAVQVAPAVNVGVLNSGGQSIRQANSNSSNAVATNVNSTDQEVSQSQRADG
jgi:hypothetical protein